jgi:type I restriction enzyme S subunit
MPSQLTDINPKPDKFISSLSKCNISELRLKKGDILLTRSGTIGSVTFVSKTLENTVFSDDVIRITTNKTVDIGFLYTYLKSKIGNTILQTNGYGSVITHIEPEHLADIPIPNPPDNIKKKIHDFVIRSFELRDESNELINEATTLLVRELQLPSIEQFKVKKFSKKAETNNYNIKLSNLSGRIDASFHVPIVNSIVEHLRKYADEVTTIGDTRISKRIILPGRFKRVYVEEGQGRVFFGGKQIFELDPSSKKYLSLSKHSNRIKAELEISENTILISRSGTIGKVTITPRHWEHWIASDHIIRIIPSGKEIAGYLYVFLVSDFGNCLIKRYTYGSVVDEIDDNHVAQIPFPLLRNKSVQAKINTLALEANRKRYEAYILEQNAMKILNNEVIYAKF